MSTSPASTSTELIPQWTLGDRLSKALRHADISVNDMADYLTRGRNTIGNYMSGRTRPPRAVLIAWALRTGVPLEWIETGEAPGTTDDGPEPRSTCIASVADLEARRERRARARTTTLDALPDAA